MTDVSRVITHDDLAAAAAKFKNWNRWGPDDEIGTLNYTTAADVVAAASLVRKGTVISLALDMDQRGPQGAKSNYPAMGRMNPVHLMLRTGTDAYAGVLDHRGIRAADDLLIMPLQAGTQWDGLGHIFYQDTMWNGYDCPQRHHGRRAEVRDRKDPGQDGRPRRAARRGPSPRGARAARRLRHHSRRP